MITGHDGAGEHDEFEPDSAWAYWHDNEEDDEAFAYLREEFDQAESVEPDPADWWKSGSHP